MNASTLSVLIVDDHPLMSAALATVLKDLRTSVQSIVANDAAMARRQLLLQPQLGLVLLDLNLPDMDGFELLAHLRERYPRLPVMVVSASEDVGDMRRAIAAGARAYIAKSAPPATMLQAANVVLRGDLHLPAVLCHESSAGQPCAGELNARQLDVLRLVCAGKSNKCIAYELGLAEKTVKGRITAILKALDVDNRTQALIKATRLGLIAPLQERDFQPS